MHRKQNLPRVRSWLAAILIAAAHTGARGQVTLRGSVKSVDQAPAGPVNAGKPLITRNVLKLGESAAPLTFEVSLRMRNFEELKARIARGERISQQEMAARYEPPAGDYAAVAAWLSGQGLTIVRRDSHHMAIFARGSVGQVRQALGVTFARVTFKGAEYTSAITPPSVPAALSPLLLGINGLQPHIRAHKHLIRRQDMPNALSGGASYFPKQIAQAYQATALYDSGLTGSGESIAIVIDTFPDASDLKAFWKDAGISQSIANIQFIQAVAGTLPDPSGEETLDVEWSSSMAPGAQVRVYAATDLESGDLDQAYEQVYEDVTKHPDLGIHQMSMSYGQGETYTTLSQVQTDDQYFAELAAAGVTVFASSGDDGSTPGSEGTGDESGPVQVESPASDPHVTGVGGTTLILGASNRVTSEVVWNDNGGASGGGVSEYFDRPTWQTGAGVGSGTRRKVPDVSCSADPDYGAIIVMQGAEQTVGGTSWASPTWAGFCALINQARTGAGQSSMGLLGPLIYPLLGTSNYPAGYLADFRDITSGDNATPQSDGDYDATSGYDLCTGLGSPLVQPLAQLLASSSVLVGIQMPAAVESVVAGENASFTVTVTGSSAAYQWQRMPIGATTWTNLANGGAYGGVTGPTLTISDVTEGMSGDQFQCILTIGSKTVTTAPPSVLVVTTPLSISTLAGRTGVTGLANGQGTAAQFNFPSGLAVDGSGNLYVADYGNNQIREISPSGQVSTPYGSLNGNSGSANGAGNNALFNTPNAVAVDGSGNLYVADTGNNLIRKIAGGIVRTLSSGQFNAPEGVAVDGAGNVYVADTGNDVIRKISPGGAVSLLAGQAGNAGYVNGAATTGALFNQPSAVAVDALGNVYVADFGNFVIRKISSGTVTTVAGQGGQAGYLDGLGGKALFNAPVGLTADSLGNLYIADSLVPAIGSNAAGNNVLRKLSAAGVVSTIAGQVGTTGAANGTGAAAQFYSLQAVAESSAGQVYLADTYNQTIRTGGVAATRIIALSGALAFGDVTAGQTTTGTLTISNHGDSTLTVSQIVYPAGFRGNWASGAIAAGDSQSVTVTFAPASAISYGGHVIVESDATGGADLIAVSGTGLPAPTAPAVMTASATAITGSSATLGGSVKPGGEATTVFFQYGPTAGYGMATGATGAGSGEAAVPFTATVGGLAPQSLYHYRAVASNTLGTVYGQDKTFTTLVAPVIGGNPAVYLGAADVELAGTVNPGGLSTVASFQYGTSTGYGSQTAPQSLGNGKTAVGVKVLLPGLAPGTLYHFRIVATSPAGTYYGPDETFTTLSIATTLVAATGEAAGTAGARFSVLGSPAINNSDFVAFRAGLQIGPGGVTASNNSAIWAENASGTLQLAAAAGGIAPGTRNAVFSAMSNPVYNDSEAVAFVGILKEANGQADAANGAGVWSTSGGSLALVARQGAQAPGYPAGAAFGSFDALTLPDAGGVLLLATVTAGSAPGVTAANNVGIWVGNSAADLQLIVREGDVYNGKTLTGIGFLPRLAYIHGQTRNIGRASGDLVFRAVFSDGTTGIILVSGSNSKLVAQTGSSAPGVLGAEFAAFGNPAMNGKDDAAFAGTLAIGPGGVAASDSHGIWANDDTGTLQLAARAGAPAPGTSGVFSSLGNPVYNDNEAIAFRGTLQAAAGEAAAATAAGVWSNSGGALALVARQGGQAPGCPEGATFAAFNSIALPDQGGVVMLAGLNPGMAGVTAANSTGIWAVDTGGNLQLIVRQGDILNGKRVTGLSFLPSLPYAGGQSRSFAQGAGDLVYGATFSDGTSAIFEVLFP